MFSSQVHASVSARGLSSSTTTTTRRCSTSLAAHSVSAYHTRLVLKSIGTRESPRCSLGVQELSMDEPVESEPSVREVLRSTQNRENDLSSGGEGKDEKEGDDDGDDKGISRIQVPRQSYIPVSKAELLDAIVLRMFDSPDEAHQFVLISSFLDSILHAEHKSTLEEMRDDYFLIHSMENEETINDESSAVDIKTTANGNKSDLADSIGFGSLDRINRYAKEGPKTNNKLASTYGLDLRNILDALPTNVKQYSYTESSLAVATRFQRAFVQLLYDAQFEELSARDLMLTSALNTDYLLTLPIYVDWKRASESNAIIFRRGYAAETQKGLLLVEKLDYIQSKLLRGIFSIISKPLGRIGKWIDEALMGASRTQEVQDWIKKIKPWLEELALFRQTYFDNEQTSDTLLGVDRLSDSDLPIWLAAQRAVSRYEGFLSPVGPRERLFRKLLTWTGIVPPTREIPYEIDHDNSASEPYLRPTFLSRISLSDLWRPAARKYCENNLWKMFKTSISILFSPSFLQEPAFQELILLYNKDASERGNRDKVDVPSFQLKIYEKIPIPDLPVIFPHKKLSFRIIDTVRLDIATILGLLAYFINYKFEDIVSSPSAILLDVIAFSALIVFGTRVALGYKQTWDRYQLLVNKTLYEKTLASGFGSVHFLLDASEQQQYKEAILTYAILLKKKSGQVNYRRNIGDECESFLYNAFKAKAKMPVDKAMNTLIRLGLVTETSMDGNTKLQAIPCSKAYEVLKDRWNSLLC
ncbi:uncharacterized protein LOC119984326 isoform X2 [Tripterygium wilfordii]|uniref:uncharacterized protein LOC119984326 isoform X2 n=1 Tax=Tripterygium wilfordii TaxID=458696 RepID=UPI0018F83A16|nr:uncharacterized protein LOC119984326 isoform X2 [Tripterygium wilfordii]